MNLTLKNTDFEADGIFGELKDPQSNVVAYTLQHAYDSQQGNGSYTPKLPAGTYTCKLGLHRLAHMVDSFYTYEITNVPGHTNILFHVGNYNSDSEGCVLLGTARQGEMIIGSRAAFEHFMELQNNVDQFKLTVLN